MSSGGGLRSAPTDAEARVTRYADDNGLEVTTFVARAERPVTSSTNVFVRGVADHVVLTPRPLHPPHQRANQPTGHFDADVVTSASSTAGGAAGADKWRYEGVLGGQRTFEVSEVPITVRAFGRVSSEPDYSSYSGIVRATGELGQRNTTISLFGGYGYDEVKPFEPPPGQQRDWPASHDRLLVGASVAQLLSPALVLSAGLGATRQHGALENPYRRAVVRTTLFPEAVPEERYRYTFVLALAWHLGWGTALHLSQGAYADTWGVASAVPQVQIAKELGSHALLVGRYRFVGQTSASFYEPVYLARLPTMTGDARLGTLREHAGALGARWTIIGDPGEAFSLTVFAEQEVSRLEYLRLLVNQVLIASVSTIGVGSVF